MAWTESDYFRKAHAQAHAPKGTYQGHPDLEVFQSVIEGTEVVGSQGSDSDGKTHSSSERTTLLPAEIEEIISHMNSDHSDAVLTYVHHYAGSVEAKNATLDKVNEETMWISADIGGVRKDLEIPLSKRISNIKEAENVMVEMVFSARAQMATED